MKTSLYRINALTIHHEINIRPLNSEVVDDYAQDMIAYGEDKWQDAWGQYPIITETRHLWSGFHTVAAALQAFGSNHEIICEVRGKNEREAFFLATGTNARHGHRRTNAEKRAAVMRWL